MKIFRRDPVHPIRQRLWQGALTLFVIVFSLACADAWERVTDKSHTLGLGADFLPVYCAGILVREGRGAELYERNSIAHLEWKIIEEEDLGGLANYGAYLNPPFFAAMYVPFTWLSYRSALTAWVWLNFALTAGAIVLLCRMLPRASPSGSNLFPLSRYPGGGLVWGLICGICGRIRRTDDRNQLRPLPSPPPAYRDRGNADGARWKHWGLIPLLLLAAFPLREAMMYQQNTFLSLFLLCVIVTLWRATKPVSPLRLSPAFCAGIAAGFLFYKPQLALAVAAVLALTRGWRAVWGMAIMGLIWLVLGVAVMPGATVSFLHNLGPTTRWLQEDMPYHWHQQMTPVCFFRFLSQGFGLGPTHLLPKTFGLIVSGVFAVALGAAIVKYLRGRAGSLDRLIGATIVTMPLLMPYYMDYDLLLLAVPAVLLAADWLSTPGPKSRIDHVLLWTWCAFFLDLYINPGLARNTRVNVGLLMIATISAISLVRCLGATVAISKSTDYDSPTLAAAA